MSFYSTIEFILHIESIFNIDLTHQGYYFLKFRFYQLLNNQEKKIIQPYNIFESESKSKEKYFKPDFDTLQKSCYSSSLLIRFCEENISLNQIFQFKTEIKSFPNFEQLEIFFECELYFYNIMDFIKENKKIIHPKKRSDFIKISTFNCKINNSYKNISEYIPIIFDDNDYCIVNADIHTFLIDFKYKNELSEKYKQPLVLTILKDSEKKLIDEFKTEEKKNDKDIFNNITNFFNNFINDSNSIYNFYNSYKKILMTSFETSKINYNNLFENLFDKNRNNYILETFEEENFSFVFNLKDSEKIQEQNISNMIMTDLHTITKSIYILMIKYIDLIFNNSVSITNYLRNIHNLKMKERWGETVFRDRIPVRNYFEIHESRIGENHKSVAKTIRKKPYFQNLDALNIENSLMFPKPEINPILFHEIFFLDKNPENSQIKYIKKKSSFLDKTVENKNFFQIIVLVHGFQGNSFDMKIFKNLLNTKYQNAHFICSLANEDNTECDITIMGRNLAKEIKTYIIQFCTGNQPNRISFIGHSLGGLIIRTALEHLKEYKNVFHTFLTLSTPHLGYLYNDSSIVDAGLWVLKKWKKIYSLNQLCLSDSKNYEETFIFKLSKKEGLNWFKNIVLVSSYQDKYCPFDSARIQISPKIDLNTKAGKTFAKMCENIFGLITINRVHRIDVNFNIISKDLDQFIGRSAHIQFLENYPLLRTFVYTFDSFFK